MRLLDLFCGAGGAGMGYWRAGFEVVGVDIKEQPGYPFGFVQGDAIEHLVEHGHNFDAIHASPPCQSYSRAMKHLAAPQPMLIGTLLQALKSVAPKVWIIENVEGAPMPTKSNMFGEHGCIVCGSALGLRVYRHRLFQSNIPIAGTECNHGRHAMNPHNQAGRERIYKEFGRSDPEVVWRKAMGVEWMNRYEGREAVPPLYTQYIGKQVMRVLRG